MKQFVYVMSSASGLTKIGVSHKPEIRRAAVQSGGGHAVTLFRIFGPFNAARRVESIAHAGLSNVRMCGEWFECTPQAAADVVDAALSSFEDDADAPERDVAAVTSAAVEFCTGGFRRSLEGFVNDADQTVRKYADLVDRYAALTDEFVEACELVDFYAEHAKEMTFMAKKAMEQIARLEKQIADQKALLEAQALETA